MSALLDYVRCQAHHNRWANQQVIAAIAALSDDEYYESVIPEAKSIHFVLNHALAIDKLWIGEVVGKDSGIESSIEILHDKKQDYVVDREATDRDIVRIVEGFTEADLEAILYVDEPEGGEAEWPFIYEVAHVFRHQVHHRGQLATLLLHTSAPSLKIDHLYLPEPRETASPQDHGAGVGETISSVR